jgi:hypothetical protein
MFGTILTSIVTLFHLYVVWRVSSIPLINRRISRRTIASAGGVMWGLFLFGRLYGHDNPGRLAGAFEFFSMNWMATLFLCAFCFLCVDLLTGFGRLWSRNIAALRTLALSLGLLLTGVALVQGMRAPVISNHVVALDGLPSQLEGTVIVAVSDLHLGSLLDEKWLAARVAQIEAAKPDLIVLLGDIYEGHGDPAPGLRTELARLKAPFGVWGVLGNHESYRGEDLSSEVFSGNGFTLLRNRWAEVDAGLVLVGVDDLTRNRRNGNGHALLQQALAGRPEGAAILLSHSPLYADVAADAGIGLMLSGHTHGGQLWPFNYLVQQYYPLLAGEYQSGGMTVLVGRGTGTWGPRMRLWAPAEIMRITLQAALRSAP